MTHSREILQMDNNQSRPSGLEKNRGFHLSRKQAFFCTLFFVGSLVATAWLTFHFTSKSLKPEEYSEGGSSPPDRSPSTSDVGDRSSDGGNPLGGRPKAPAGKVAGVRLPTAVVPHFYEIKLVPFLSENNFTFGGHVRILVNLTENANNVTLHANDLDIDAESVSVSHVNGGKVLLDGLDNDTSRQFFVIRTKEDLLSGRQYEVEMRFVGHLNDELQGFYRSSYAVGNATRWIATTQFQATDARRAFPCFDEPSLKARFKLHIGRPTHMTSISNMPQLTTGKPVEGVPNYVWDEYRESVPMSTYLVAFVVSDFSHISEGKFSVWARDAAISQAKYSLEIGPKILNYFESYFGINFPLPKMDMIALPDFAAGAMENWGLVTYRETAMLYDPAVSSSNSKQRVATVISHELAHQWFGNLVTPSWWSDLWLNEGFASYVEYLGVEAVEPSWKIMDQFVTSEVQNVFALDALRTSHQISIEVHHPDEISEIFDRISYGKGASLIRMMDHFLTTPVFKKGLSKYLERHKFGNSEQDDLWMALTEQAREDGVLPTNASVKTIMDTWTLQTGFPVVTVTRDYNKRSAIVNQERFLLYKPTPKMTEEHSRKKVAWWVPITYTTSREPDFKSTRPSHWMKQENKIVVENLPSREHWVMFNVQQTGFYRVNYDEENWKLLTRYLKDPLRHENIHPINRAQVIDDALNLARAELLSYDVAMNVTRYLSHELEYLPWKSAFTAFSYLDDMLIKTAGYDKFKVYMLKIIQRLYDQVGFERRPEDTQLTIYKRIYVLSWACALGHSDCVNNSVDQFQRWKQTPDPDRNNPISPDMKSVVYCTAIRVGNEHDWNFAWERFKNWNVASEKDILLEALGCSRDLWILSRLLDWAVTENSGIRKQDVARLFSSVSDNPVGQILVFEYLTEQWDRLKSYLGGSLFTIGSIVKSATKTINSKSQLKQLVEFSNAHRNEFGPATRAVEQAIEQADANIRWMTNNYDSLVRWLSDAVR